MTTTTNHPYIVRVDGVLSGEPVLKGSRVPVRAIVEEWRLGYTPEESLRAHPHLSLAAIFDALSYYQDYMGEINAHIARNRITQADIEESRRAMDEHVRKLREAKRLAA